MEVATDQIYCYLSSICRQNSLKAKRFYILFSSREHVSCGVLQGGVKDYTPNIEIRILKPICKRFCLRA